MVWINTDIRYIGHYVELPNTQILKKYLIGITLSVQISPKLFDQKYVNLYEFQVLSDFFILVEMVCLSRRCSDERWCDEDENIMNLGCYTQSVSTCTASVQNLPLNISLRYFDWFLLVDHPDYKVLHHILDQCSSSYTRYKWTILTTKTKIQIKIKFYGTPIYLKSYNMFT